MKYITAGVIASGVLTVAAVVYFQQDGNEAVSANSLSAVERETAARKEALLEKTLKSAASIQAAAKKADEEILRARQERDRQESTRQAVYNAQAQEQQAQQFFQTEQAAARAQDENFRLAQAESDQQARRDFAAARERNAAQTQGPVLRKNESVFAPSEKFLRDSRGGVSRLYTDPR